ncbi:MAG TPA: cytochrome P450 [Streptosporangiaceae bacterium]|jgi:cytochrome P450
MTELDLWNDRADPYPGYARLRDDTPVARATGPMGMETWLITRHADARAALSDPRLAKSPRNAPDWVHASGLMRGDDEGPLGVNLLTSDPPDHTRLRRLVSKAFTRRRMEGLRPRVQDLTDGLLDAMAPGTEVDLIAGLALPLPVAVISELLGVPYGERADFHRWTQAFVTAPLSEEGLARRDAAWASLEEYVGSLIERKRAELDPGTPADDLPDLISALVATHDASDRLTTRELIGMIALLLIAGHETTVNLIGNGMRALLTHPDQLEILRSRPELMPDAIEELLRYDGPVERATPRYTLEDVTFGDVTVPAGSHVTVVLAAADHDPAYVPDADRLDITRTDHGHLAFGHGIHFCLGAPLARIEGEIAIGSLLRRFPDLALAVSPDDVRWRAGGAGNILRGLESLPLRL